MAPDTALQFSVAALEVMLVVERLSGALQLPPPLDVVVKLAVAE